MTVSQMFLVFCFLGAHPWHMGAPRLGDESKLQLLAYATASATRDLNPSCILHHSSGQRQIPNPVGKARVWTCILMDTSWICFWCATAGTAKCSLFLTTLIVLSSIGQVYCKTALYWNLSDGFLMIRLRLWFWERKITELKCHFHHVISRIHTINMIYDYWCWPLSPGRTSVYQFSPVENYMPSPFPSCTLWKEVIMCIPHVRSAELFFPSFEVECLRYLFEFFPAGLMSRDLTGSGWVLFWHFKKKKSCWAGLLFLSPNCAQPNSTFTEDLLDVVSSSEANYLGCGPSVLLASSS